MRYTQILDLQELTPMERPKLTAIVTGAISLVLGILYLLGVQILDAREMVPAPIGLVLGWVTYHI